MERLFRELEADLDLLRIEAVISQCRRDRCGSPPAAQPELIERLAAPEAADMDPSETVNIATTRSHHRGRPLTRANEF